MRYTTNRVHGMYSFATSAGNSLRTLYSPRQIANMYCFDAIDDKNNLRVVLSRDVDFTSFEYLQYISRQSAA
ncbi:hypothetical protein GXP67_32045 [Rhodocytophaga rosea]|uniref:Uncharacterized protein n=1 Tax=Rhodocytophaga rosea TaxID=2704465 RepID=A0A6C0GS79_9BACT|nr:hypothetical protein [Rhodocytophaga rosea]QHT70951.1 hypothetical protein GXP67_32045 [Rhodocytophaga rosea]